MKNKSAVINLLFCFVVYHILSGAELTIEPHHLPIYGVCFSKGGKYLAAGSWDSVVILWDAEELKSLVSRKEKIKDGPCIKEFAGHGDKVNCVDFSSDENLLASGSADGTIKIWETQPTFKKILGIPYRVMGEKVKKPIKTLKGHKGEIFAVTFSTCGRYLFSASADGSVKIWDVEKSSCIKTFKGHKGAIYSLSLHPKGRYFATAGEDKLIRIWDVKKSTPIKKFKAHKTAINSVCFSSDGKLIASGGWRGYLKIWNIDGKLIKKKYTGTSIASIAFSPDGEFLAICGGLGFGGGIGGLKKEIVILRTKNWKIIDSFGETTFEEYHSICFSPDGAYLAASRSDGLKIWRLPTYIP
jgi:uncharacterized protein with WD repeat